MFTLKSFGLNKEGKRNLPPIVKLMTCPVCSGEFTPKTDNQVYCSKECAKKANNKRNMCKANAKRDTRAKPYETPDFRGIDGEAIKDGWALRMPTIYKDESRSYSIISEGDNYLFVNNFNNAYFEKSHYVMLQVDGCNPLFAECLLNESLPVKRLSTMEICDYLIKLPKAFYVGYFLGYDFQEWMHDLGLKDQDELFEYGKEARVGKYIVSGIKKKFFTVRLPNTNVDSYVELCEKHKNKVERNQQAIIAAKEAGLDYEGEIFLETIEKGILLNEYGYPKLSFKETYVQDYSGYWQMSFESALEKNMDVMDDGDKEIIANGKALRSKFNRKYWRDIAKYNETECKLMSRMMIKLFDDVNKGFSDSSIKIIPRGKDAFSPGALSNRAFNLLKWKSKHPRFNTSSFKDKFLATLSDEYAGKEGVYTKSGVRCDDWKERLGTLPFLAAYFGGRIEATKAGMIKPLKLKTECGIHDKELCALWGADIRSGYPMGISMMPEWDENSAVYHDKKSGISEAVDSRLAGMFLLEWNLPKKWVWYPFPYRTKEDRVFFPASGNGWVSSLEYYAFLDTLNAAERGVSVKVKAALVLKDSFGLGFVNQIDEPPTETGKFFVKMYNERALMKKAKNPGEKALKLTPNGMYGKLIQQVGVKNWKDSKKMRYFSDFGAMWTSAYCRATVWLAIAEYKADEDAVFAVQTDGIYSQKPFHIDTRNKLGSWEIEDEEGYAWFLLYMPGIYAYAKWNKDGTSTDYKQDDAGNIIDFKNIKRRGWSKEFNMVNSWQLLQAGEKYTLPMDTYVSPLLAELQPNKYSYAEFLNGVSYSSIYNSAINKRVKHSQYFDGRVIKLGGCEWHRMYKTLEISLGSKRAPYENYSEEDFNFKGDKKVFYFPPKKGANVMSQESLLKAILGDGIKTTQNISKPYIPIFIPPYSLDALRDSMEDCNDDVFNMLEGLNIEDYEGGTGGGVFER